MILPFRRRPASPSRPARRNIATPPGCMRDPASSVVALADRLLDAERRPWADLEPAEVHRVFEAALGLPQARQGRR